MYIQDVNNLQFKERKDQDDKLIECLIQSVGHNFRHPLA